MGLSKRATEKNPETDLQLHRPPFGLSNTSLHANNMTAQEMRRRQECGTQTTIQEGRHAYLFVKKQRTQSAHAILWAISESEIKSHLDLVQLICQSCEHRPNLERFHFLLNLQKL